MEFLKYPLLWQHFLKNNGYVVGPCVGQGGFGDVFSIMYSKTSKKYAIKRIISRKNIMTEASVVREIEALAELRHSCVIEMKEILLCDHMACIVMELASCGNLEMFIQTHNNNNNLSLQIITKIFRQIAQGIEFCHGNDIAHRDINPSNVLVFDSGDVKIADFGLCFRCKDKHTGCAIPCTDYLGQELYLAPEVNAHQPYLAMPADVWSLGCVLLFIGSNHAQLSKNKMELCDNDNGLPGSNSNNTSNVVSISGSKTANVNSVISLACAIKRHDPLERLTATQIVKKITILEKSLMTDIT